MKTESDAAPPGLINFIESLDQGRTASDLALFEWSVKDWVESKAEEALEYFSDLPELLQLELHGVQGSLEFLMQWLIESEEYERCEVVKRILEDLEKRASSGVFKSRGAYS